MVGQELLKDNFNLQARILEQMSEAVLLINTQDSSIVFTNGGAEKTFGYGKGEMVGLPIAKLNATADKSSTYKSPQVIAAEIINILNQKGVWQGEIRNIKKDGTQIWCSATVSTFMHSVHGEVWLAVHRDITEHKQAEAALRKNEERLRMINSSVPGIVYQFKVDAKGNRSLPYASPTVEKYIGLSAKTVMDDVDKWFGTTHPDDLPGLKASIVESMENMTPWEWEGRFIRNGNDVLWLRGSSTPAKLDDGSILWNGVFTDITDHKKAEQSLIQSEERYHALARVTPVGVFRTDEHGNCIYVNERWCEMAGMNQEQAINEGWANALHPDDRDRVFAEWYQAAVDKIPFKTECRFQRHDGKVTWLLSQAEAELDAEGQLRGYVGAITDISERKQVEVALQESESLLEKAQHLAEIGHWKLIPATGEVTGSDELFRIFGLNAEEATLDAFVEVVHPDDREMDIAAIQRGAEHGESWDIEHRLICRDGKEKWVHAVGEAITDKDGKVIELVGTVQDITKLKQAEQALLDSELWMRSIFDSLDEAVLVVSPDRHILNVNEATVKMFGYTAREIFNSSTEIFHVDNLHYLEFGERINAAFAMGQTANFEFELKRKNTEIFPTEHTVSLLKTPDGIVKGIVSIIRDISLRKQTEQKLGAQTIAIEQSRAGFEAMFESIPDAVVYADPERKIRLVNQAAIKLFGYKNSELIGNQTKMLYGSPDDFQQQGKVRFNPDIVKNLAPSEFTYRCKNGKEFQGETVGAAVRSTEGDVLGYIGIIRDITERIQVENIFRSLAESTSSIQFEPFMNDVLERLTELYDCQYAFISQLQADGQLAKTLAMRADGKPAENFEYLLEGTPCQNLMNQQQNVVPKHVQNLYPYDQFLVDMNAESYFGTRLVASDGKILGLIVVMDTKPLKLDEWTEPVLGVFATRVSLELERDIAIKEIQQHRETLQELVIERTADLSAARDEAERANHAKSDFLSRMSHELRTPLNAILGFGQMLEMDAKDFNEIQSGNVKEIIEAGRHLLKLINEVLDLTKIESGTMDITMEQVSIDELMQTCIRLIDRQAKLRQLEIINNIYGKAYVVQADLTHLKQVLLNLLSNAVKYNREQGRITLEGEIIDDQRLRISITDTGRGLTEEDIEKLFNPFERLNAMEDVEGTGIGLVITKHLIESMNGNIGIDSTPGEGSTFWVVLDLSNDI